MSASPSRPGDAAAVSVQVAVLPAEAFEIFTQETDLWWRRGPQFRVAGNRRGTLGFEGGVGGRLFETFDTPAGPFTHETGRITAWQPPHLLRFEWRGVNFKPGELTFVEVHFEASGAGTLVTVRHSGWSALPTNHPARHGLVGPDFSRRIGLHWGQLMTAFREHIAQKR